MRIDPTQPQDTDSELGGFARAALTRTIARDDWPAATWWATDLWSHQPEDMSARAAVAFTYARLHKHVASHYEFARKALGAINERLDARRRRELTRDEVQDTAARMLRAHLLDILVGVAQEVGKWYDEELSQDPDSALPEERERDLRTIAAVLAGEPVVGDTEASEWISTLSPESAERVARRRECAEATLRTLIALRDETAWGSTVVELARRWERDFPEDLDMAELLAGMQSGADGIEDFATRRDAYALQFARMGGQLQFAQRMSRRPV